eukprot:scaffold264497_cov28-Tisochrysis_lutea.AAC.2
MAYGVMYGFRGVAWVHQRRLSDHGAQRFVSSSKELGQLSRGHLKSNAHELAVVARGSQGFPIEVSRLYVDMRGCPES